MPEGMVLKSERFASNLWDPERRYTLERYSKAHGLPYQAVGKPISRELFLEYADWFRQQVAAEAHDAKVTLLRRSNRGFSLDLANGSQLISKRVVLATGHMPFRMVPAEFAILPEPQVLHSTLLGDVKSYIGRDITIVGAGQSALETAALLHETGAHVRVLIRRPRVEWNAPSMPRPLWQRILEPDAGVASGWKSFAISELPRTFRWRFPSERRHRFVAGSYGPSGSWWLRERVEGKVNLCVSSEVQSVAVDGRGVRVSLKGPVGLSEFTTDHVIAATGFKVDIDRLDYLEPALRQSIAREAGGIPALSSSFETSVSGLFIVGVASAPIFGPIMRFMYGAKHVAPVLARRLRSTH
jgi:FAD-dependent urate hydroxylase